MLGWLRRSVPIGGDRPSLVEWLALFPVKRIRGSLADWARAWGYSKAKDMIDADALAAVLSGRPELIEAWDMLSADKRTSEGWYFREAEGGGREVGFHPRGPRLRFADPARACAEFILRELG